MQKYDQHDMRIKKREHLVHALSPLRKTNAKNQTELIRNAIIPICQKVIGIPLMNSLDMFTLLTAILTHTYAQAKPEYTVAVRHIANAK
jgi:hypothetical protein